MVPKSGHRFSEKIMLSQYAAARPAIVELFRVSEPLRQDDERAAQGRPLDRNPDPAEGGGGAGPGLDLVGDGRKARPLGFVPPAGATNAGVTPFLVTHGQAAVRRISLPRPISPASARSACRRSGRRRARYAPRPDS